MSDLRMHKNVVSALVTLSVVILTIASIELRPVGANWSLWRPATGVAVGVASWYPSRDAWRVALAAGVGSFVGGALTGRPVSICVATGITAVLEAWIGSRVLRARTGRIPALTNWAALRRLLLAAGAVGVVTAVVIGAITTITGGLAQVIPSIAETAPVHMTAALIVAPLFFVAPPTPPRITKGEVVLQWLILAVMIFLVFRLSFGLPMTFLLLPPLVWGANRLRYRTFLVQLFLTAAVTARLTSNLHGPFGSNAIDQTSRTLLLGTFELTISSLVFTIIASSAITRLGRIILDRAERFQWETIEASPIGFAVLTATDDELTLSEVNTAGRAILRLQRGQSLTIDDMFTGIDARIVHTAFDRLAADPPEPWTRELAETISGRVLEASMVAWSGTAERRASFQFIDVTDREAALAREAIERRRAVDIQSVLIPHAAITFPGYQVAGRSVSSKELGGDFYDWYGISEGFAVTLGDVMGKGTGASMVAAALRTSMRLESGARHPAAAVARVARVIETELNAVSTFATVFTAHIRTRDGRIRYADAGHGLAVLSRADGTLSQLNSGGLPVGILEESQWSNSAARLHHGDTLVIFSDGVLDLFDGSLVAFDEIVRISHESSSTDDLIDRVFALLDPETMDDDVTVVAIRRLEDQASA